MATRLTSRLPVHINEVTTWYSEALVLPGRVGDGQAERTEETTVSEKQLIIRLTEV